MIRNSVESHENTVVSDLNDKEVLVVGESVESVREENRDLTIIEQEFKKVQNMTLEVINECTLDLNNTHLLGIEENDILIIDNSKWKVTYKKISGIKIGVIIKLERQNNEKNTN